MKSLENIHKLQSQYQNLKNPYEFRSSQKETQIFELFNINKCQYINPIAIKWPVDQGFVVYQKTFRNASFLVRYHMQNADV
jgi:hypothetical protein